MTIYEYYKESTDPQGMEHGSFLTFHVRELALCFLSLRYYSGFRNPRHIFSWTSKVPMFGSYEAFWEITRKTGNSCDFIKGLYYYSLHAPYKCKRRPMLWLCIFQGSKSNLKFRLKRKKNQIQNLHIKNPVKRYAQYRHICQIPSRTIREYGPNTNGHLPSYLILFIYFRKNIINTLTYVLNQKCGNFFNFENDLPHNFPLQALSLLSLCILNLFYFKHVSAR